MLDHANDLFSGLEDQLTRDLDAMRSNWTLHPARVVPPTQLYGPADQVLVAEDAVVRAATLDTSGGAIVIGPGARVEPGSHLEGPLVVHEGAVVRTGAHIRGATVIGPHCKVGGEIANVHFQGWANKAHGGFLGNSVIGRWCNLGAGTVSSNLKNTYGSVRQWSHASGQMEDSGLFKQAVPECEMYSAENADDENFGEHFAAAMEAAMAAAMLDEMFGMEGMND